MEGSFLSGGAFARRGGAGMKIRQRGLAEVVGIPAALCVLVVLPVAGLATLLLGGPAAAEPAT